MPVLIENEISKEPTIRLKLTRSGDVVTVEDAIYGWSILGLKIEDGKLKFFRYSGIYDGKYSTDDSGKINESGLTNQKNKVGCVV